MTEENDLIALRREQLQQLRETGTAFRNDFRRDSLSEQLLARYGDKSKEELAKRLGSSTDEADAVIGAWYLRELAYIQNNIVDVKPDIVEVLNGRAPDGSGSGPAAWSSAPRIWKAPSRPPTPHPAATSSWR